MIINYQYISRIEDSKTLGKVVHINLFANKTCTFDCLYCGDGPTINKMVSRVLLFPLNNVTSEIQDYIEKNGEPNYLWYSCKGEPTLYLFFGRINQTIKRLYPKIKIGTWTNGALLNREDVFEELRNCDFVIIGLDTVIKEEFMRLNRPHESVNFEILLTSIKKFKENYSGKLWIHTAFLKDFNDNPGNIDKLEDFLNTIVPHTFFVSFSEKGATEPLPDDFKLMIKEKFKDLEFKFKLDK
ncbi:MAG: radical SAM protein [Asgard group archaeon]|nr:radical SAM protein [Asgard group archaeon]